MARGTSNAIPPPRWPDPQHGRGDGGAPRPAQVHPGAPAGHQYPTAAGQHPGHQPPMPASPPAGGYGSDPYAIDPGYALDPYAPAPGHAADPYGAAGHYGDYDQAAYQPPAQSFPPRGPQGHHYASPPPAPAPPQAAPPAYHYPADPHEGASRPTLQPAPSASYAPQFERYQPQQQVAAPRERTAPPAFDPQHFQANRGWNDTPSHRTAPQGYGQGYDAAPGYDVAAEPAQVAQRPSRIRGDARSEARQEPSFGAQHAGYEFGSPSLRGSDFDEPQPAPQLPDPAASWPPHGQQGAYETYATENWNDPAAAWPPQPAPHAPPQFADAPGYQSAAYNDPHHYAAHGTEAAQAMGYGQEAGYDQQGGAYEDDQRYAPPGEGGELVAGDHDEHQDFDYEDQEEPGRRFGFGKIAAVLVAAVVVGGGMAYGYVWLTGPGGGDGSVPVVRDAGSPSRVKPSDPGGRKFANTDSKVLGRLGESSSAPAAAARPAPPAADAAPAPASTDDASGPRKVTTMVVGRDGSITTVGSPPPESQPRLPVGVTPVPGLTIVDGFGNRPQAPAAPPVARVAPPSAAPPVASVPARQEPRPPPAAAAKPVVIARADSDAAVSDASPPAARAPARATVEKPRSAVAKPERRAAATPAATPPRAAGGLGYVAVLASIPASGGSRMEALKQFADLQQRYGGQLAGRSPDVQEADLGAKGRYHRLVAGPPGSKDQARQLCNDLKAAGYGSCWVKAY
ncbi:MAG: SPOR domain-containing protein [Hyphomicrobiaceae bacterium]